MKTTYKKLFIVFGTAIFLTACNPTKQEIGKFVGAGTGAFIGSHIGDGTGQLAAVAIGTLVGSQVGSNIGAQMDELDRYRAQSALETAPTGSTTSWVNPDTNVEYNVTPTYTYETASGACRDYTTEAVIDGRAEVLHGTACRESDGTWHAMN